MCHGVAEETDDNDEDDPKGSEFYAGGVDIKDAEGRFNDPAGMSTHLWRSGKQVNWFLPALTTNTSASYS